MRHSGISNALRSELNWSYYSMIHNMWVIVFNLVILPKMTKLKIDMTK